MNKKEAMEYLGKSERTLGNYVKDGRLPVRYVETKNGNAAFFEPSDLEKLKAELDGAASVARVVTPVATRVATTVANRAAPVAKNEDLPLATATLAIPESNIQVGQGGAELIAEILTESLTTSLQNVADKDASILASKLLLTIPEAMSYSGVKEKPIRDAIKAGALKSIRIGRSIQVRPEDLKRWVDSQF